MGRGKREKGEAPAFSHFPSFAASCFSIIAIFIGIPSGSLLGGERYFPTFDQKGCRKLVPRAFLLENGSGEREKFWGKGGGGGGKRFSVIKSFLITFVPYY